MKTYIQKLFSLVVKLNSRAYKNLTTLSFHRFTLLAFPIALFFSGIFKDPIFALLIGAIYIVGFLGLVTLYESRKKETTMLKYCYLILGWLVVVISYIWLEIICVVVH